MLENLKFYSQFKVASDTMSGRQSVTFVARLLYQAANSFFSIKKVSGYLDQPFNSCFELWMSNSFLSSSKTQNSIGRDVLLCLPSPPMCTIVLSLNNFKMKLFLMGKVFWVFRIYPDRKFLKNHFEMILGELIDEVFVQVPNGQFVDTQTCRWIYRQHWSHHHLCHVHLQNED